MRFRERTPTIQPRIEIGRSYTWYNYPRWPQDWRYANTKYWPPLDLVTRLSECRDEIHPYRAHKRKLVRKRTSRNYLGKRPKTRYRWIGTDRWRDGGPFFKKDGYIEFEHSARLDYTNFLYKYVGDFRVVVATNSFPDYSNYSENAAVYGATCWNRFKPNRPSMGLAQAYAELKDFGSMFKPFMDAFKGIRKTHPTSKDAGSDYLNWQFGWKPFIGDLKRFLELSLNVDKKLNFLIKNNGKWLKRKGTLKAERDVNSWTENSRLTPILASRYYATPTQMNPCKVNQTITTDVWFAARMKYFIPDTSWDKSKYSTGWRKKLLRRIYGLEITPSLVWELTPWSWFADWFGNFGDCLSNLTDVGELVTSGAWVMEHRNLETEYCQEQTLLVNNGSSLVKATAKIVQECKERAVASPFGFGLTGESFTPSRVAILAALGLSRLHR